MILAEDLITLLKKIDPSSEVVVYEGGRSGLHLSDSEGEPFGWIEVGDYEDRILVNDHNHQI